MPNELGDSGESRSRSARYATRTMTVSRPTTPPNPDIHTPRADDGEATVESATAQAQPRALIVAAGIVALVVAVLLVLVAGGGESSAVAQATGTATAKPQATATLSPTTAPTETTVPVPTPMSGFKVYVDQQNGFFLQYPVGWAASPLTGEVDFQDTANSDVSFEMFVLTPDPSLLASKSTEVQTAGAWVDHVLNTESQLHGGAFIRIPGPMPSGQFAGTEWQSGEGLLGSAPNQVRVQVFVTIHEGAPYVIGIAAADSAFDFAKQDYFESMLTSFTFLPSNP